MVVAECEAEMQQEKQLKDHQRSRERASSGGKTQQRYARLGMHAMLAWLRHPWQLQQPLWLCGKESRLEKQSKNRRLA